MTDNLNQKIGKATAWSSVTEILAKLISPIVNIVLARLLLPEAFGIVATITMVISFAEVFTDAGFQKYIVQKEFKNEDELNQSTIVAFWTNLCMSAFVCIIIYFFRNKIASIVGDPELGNAISIASLSIMLYAFSSIQMARYKRDFDFKTLFFVRIGTSLIPLFITIPLAIVLRNFWALLIGNFASQIFNAIVLTVKSKWKIKFYYSFSLLKQMLSFSAFTLLESISIWLTANIDIFIISNCLNQHYLGLYKTSISTINSYLGLITAAIVPVLFSALSRNQENETEFKKTYYLFQKLTAAFVIPMGIGIYLFSDLITLILLGENWLEASGFMGIWGLTSAFTIIFSHFSSEVFRSKGKPLISLIVQISQILVLIPVLLIFKDHGFSAIYISRSLVRIELMLISLILMCSLYKFNILTILKNNMPMIISASIMGFAGYMLQKISSHILWQFAVIAICVLIYLTILLSCFSTVRREIMELPIVKKTINKVFKKNVSNK